MRTSQNWAGAIRTCRRNSFMALGVLSHKPVQCGGPMLKIAARRGSTIALSVLSCAFLSGAAMADPSIQQTQRSSEGSPGQHTCMPHAKADQQLRAHFGEKVLGRGISSDG